MKIVISLICILLCGCSITTIDYVTVNVENVVIGVDYESTDTTILASE